jgi:hypothetical protein
VRPGRLPRPVVLWAPTSADRGDRRVARWRDVPVGRQARQRLTVPNMRALGSVSRTWRTGRTCRWIVAILIRHGVAFAAPTLIPAPAAVLAGDRIRAAPAGGPGVRPHGSTHMDMVYSEPGGGRWRRGLGHRRCSSRGDVAAAPEEPDQAGPRALRGMLRLVATTTAVSKPVKHCADRVLGPTVAPDQPPPDLQGLRRSQQTGQEAMDKGLAGSALLQRRMPVEPFVRWTQRRACLHVTLVKNHPDGLPSNMVAAQRSLADRSAEELHR